MTCSILFIEDNTQKRERVVNFLTKLIGHFDLTEACSFSSGSRLIRDNEYDLVLLDMSLPTYDKVHGNAGGSFRTFGGRELARKIIRKKKKCKIAFITQHKGFSDQGKSHSIESLGKELESDCGEQYLGLVYFDSSETTWQDELKGIVRAVI